MVTKRGTLLSIAMGFMIMNLPPSNVLADPMFTVTAAPSAQTVLENAPTGIFDFTVKNVGVETFTITDVRLFGGAVSSAIVFLSGDFRDEVFNTMIVNAGNCVGKPLATNGTCNFQQTFQVRDLDVPNSGTNSGVWQLSNVVIAGGIGGTTEFGEAIVEVRDPNAPFTVPEPATWILMIPVLGALGLWRIIYNKVSMKSPAVAQ